MIFKVPVMAACKKCLTFQVDQELLADTLGYIDGNVFNVTKFYNRAFTQ